MTMMMVMVRGYTLTVNVAQIMCEKGLKDDREDDISFRKIKD